MKYILILSLLLNILATYVSVELHSAVVRLHYLCAVRHVSESGEEIK